MKKLWRRGFGVCGCAAPPCVVPYPRFPHVALPSAIPQYHLQTNILSINAYNSIQTYSPGSGPSLMATEHLPLLDSFKLPTTFFPTGVVHSHPGSAVEEVWTDISVIGHGGQGIVYLQQLQSGPTRLLRAVKLLSSDLRPAHIKSELNMMMAVRDVCRTRRVFHLAGTECDA